MDKYNEELGLKIPAHVAVILDGNGRWAKKKHMPRTYGHMQGSKVVEDMLYVADDLGIQYFTVYAFSTENWKRSEEEVGTLKMLIRVPTSSSELEAFRRRSRHSYEHFKKVS